MAALTKLIQKHTVGFSKPVCTVLSSSKLCCYQSTEANHGEKIENKNEEEFRVYEIEGLKPKESKRKERVLKKQPPPRYRSMPPDQDWTEVWPTAKTFNWSIVPFPVRQGIVWNSDENKGVVPGAYANLELMKIPNFLHLTPKHIKKHCAALKKFCTAWPEGLDTEEDCRRHFPVEHITYDYVSDGVTPHDPRARTVVIKFHLSDLDLDYHAKDKFIRLVGEKYNPKTDEVILEAERCPLKSQNLDFLNFVLTAVYFESWKTEAWESKKQLEDMEKYFWDINQSRKSILSLFKVIQESKSSSDNCRLDYLPSDLSDDDAICNLPQVQQYSQAVTDLFNEDDDGNRIDNYKNAVINMLNVKAENVM